MMNLDNVINGCKAVETGVASIYRKFMDLFPEHKLFWQDLYRDELEHSFLLSNSISTEAIELLPSQDLVPSAKLIESTVKFIEEKSRHIKLNPVTFESALRIAYQLEESMVELFANELMANIFSDDYESLSQRLVAAERLHINKIEDMMIEHGFMQVS